MADVLLLFLAALLVLGGTTAAALITRAGCRKRALERRDRPRRQRQEIDQLDNYIRQLSQAATDADIDRLEQLKEQKRWDGSSSR